MGLSESALGKPQKESEYQESHRKPRKATEKALNILNNTGFIATV